MKLSKQQIIKFAEISTLDADIRLEEFKKYRTFEPKKTNYDVNRIKTIFPDAHYFDIKNMEGLYGEIDDILFITFRGSDSLMDWIRNFIFFKKIIPYENKDTKVRIHSGFLKNYKIIRSFVHDIIKATTKTKIVFYGHSMGATLSVLASLDIQYNFPEKEIGCFTVGMPKLGNEAFKTSFEKRIPDFTMCEFRNDIVPQIPPRWFGYRHLSTFIHLGTKRNRWIGTKEDHDWHLYMDALREELSDDIQYS